MKKILAVLAAFVVSACASQPDEIHTAQVSDLQYQAYDCDQLRAEASRVSDRATDLHRQLKETADADAAQVGVGLILFWPALFLIEGGDGTEAQEYARLKGEKEAIERVSILRKCVVNFTPAPGLQSASNAQAQEAYGPLEVPKPGDEIDGRLLFDLLKGNVAEGTIAQCHTGGYSSGVDASKIQIHFRDLNKANVNINCSSTHGARFVKESFDAKWKIKGDELCFYDVPKNTSPFADDCNPVALNKFSYAFERSSAGSLEFNMKGSGLPSSTAKQIDRAVSRVKSPS